MSTQTAAETKQEHWLRRGRELNKLNKAALCALYRRMGGLGGMYPPEKWRKDEVITSIADMEWDCLPAERKLPDPPRFSPPCDECRKGENATPHHYDGDHYYTYTHNPDARWVPDSEAEEQRWVDEFADPFEPGFGRRIGSGGGGGPRD